MITLIFYSLCSEASQQQSENELISINERENAATVEVRTIYDFYAEYIPVNFKLFIHVACHKFLQEHGLSVLRQNFCKDYTEKAVNSDLAVEIKQICVKLHQIYCQHARWNVSSQEDFNEVFSEILKRVTPQQLFDAYQVDKLGTLQSHFAKTAYKVFQMQIYYKKFLTIPIDASISLSSAPFPSCAEKIYKQCLIQHSDFHKNSNVIKDFFRIGFEFLKKNNVTITDTQQLDLHLNELVYFVETLIFACEDIKYDQNCLLFAMRAIRSIALKSDILTLKDFVSQNIKKEYVVRAVRKYVVEVCEKEKSRKKIVELSARYEQYKKEVDGIKLLQDKESSKIFEASKKVVYQQLSNGGYLCYEKSLELDRFQELERNRLYQQEESNRKGFVSNIWKVLAVYDQELKARFKIEQEYSIEYLLVQQQQFQENLKKIRLSLIQDERDEREDQKLQEQKHRVVSGLLTNNNKMIRSSFLQQWKAWKRNRTTEQIQLLNQRLISVNIPTARIVRCNNPYQQTAFNEADVIDLIDTNEEQETVEISMGNHQQDQNIVPLPSLSLPNLQQADPVLKMYRYNPYAIDRKNCFVLLTSGNDN